MLIAFCTHTHTHCERESSGVNRQIYSSLEFFYFICVRSRVIIRTFEYLVGFVLSLFASVHVGVCSGEKKGSELKCVYGKAFGIRCVGAYSLFSPLFCFFFFFSLHVNVMRVQMPRMQAILKWR